MTARSSSEPLLDPRVLERADTGAFHDRRPYPWLELEGLLTEVAFNALHSALPSLNRLQPSFGRRRAYDQHPHDRYVLDYAAGLDVDDVWHRFVSELDHGPYRDWLARMLGTRNFQLVFHWHYTPRGCSVSPHCDARRKLGSHIFYFNTADDWQEGWGGETLVLDDGGRFRRNSAPAFEDFPVRHASPCIGNRSLLFRRRGNSWHGVEPLQCPDGSALRRVFIVVIEAGGLKGRLRALASNSAMASIG